MCPLSLFQVAKHHAQRSLIGALRERPHQCESIPFLIVAVMYQPNRNFPLDTDFLQNPIQYFGNPDFLQQVVEWSLDPPNTMIDGEVWRYRQRYISWQKLTFFCVHLATLTNID